MKRTPLRERPMPVYSAGEERFNMISHIVGGAIALAGMVLCIVRSALHHNGYGVGSSIVFGLAMVLMYTLSSVYHGLPSGRGKRVMQVLDHCSIYLVIAGTYTPVLLVAMRPLDPARTFAMFGVVWALAALAVTLNAVDLQRWKILSMALYIGMGWLVVMSLPLLIRSVGAAGFALLLAGGVLYTTGTVFYGRGRSVKWMHSVFHLFVVGGSVCHILAILLFVL